MKILWIVNTPLGTLGEKLYGRKESGLWMEALLDSFQNAGEYQLIIATTAKITETKRYKDNGVIYYALPDQPPINYNENKPRNIAAWKQLLETEKPDLIQVWGTEFTHGLCALREAKRIPSVIYMQGYMVSIARYYQAGIPYSSLKKSATFRDIIKRDSILQQQKKYRKSSIKEAEMLRLSGRIISENTWCDYNIQSIVPTVRCYRCPLSINEIFSQYCWSPDNIERHSIICTASGYTIKGLHMLLRALALVKKQFPDVRLYVPGEKQVSGNSLQWKLRKRGYTKYIEKLISELDINNNIVWMGNVSQEELAKQYQKTNVFVMCSAIENHSSSLKEAMMTGIPCISSYVGGIPEYVRHGENGLLYRYEEFEMLAQNICTIFTSPDIAERFSENSKKTVAVLHKGSSVFEKIIEIYSDIINEEKK